MPKPSKPVQPKANKAKAWVVLKVFQSRVIMSKKV
jgi:hypothetical protein